MASQGRSSRVFTFSTAVGQGEGDELGLRSALVADGLEHPGEVLVDLLLRGIALMARLDPEIDLAAACEALRRSTATKLA